MRNREKERESDKALLGSNVTGTVPNPSRPLLEWIRIKKETAILMVSSQSNILSFSPSCPVTTGLEITDMTYLKTVQSS